MYSLDTIDQFRKTKTISEKKKYIFLWIAVMSPIIQIVNTMRIILIYCRWVRACKLTTLLAAQLFYFCIFDFFFSVYFCVIYATSRYSHSHRTKDIQATGVTLINPSEWSVNQEKALLPLGNVIDGKEVYINSASAA